MVVKLKDMPYLKIIKHTNVYRIMGIVVVDAKSCFTWMKRVDLHGWKTAFTIHADGSHIVARVSMYVAADLSQLRAVVQHPVMCLR